MTTLYDLLINKLKALYDAESVLIDNLPELANAASDESLGEAFMDHLKETKEHSRRLEQTFKLLGEAPEKLEGEAIRGLVKDAEWVVENVEKGPARDLNLCAAASYAEHYEMAGYNA